MFGNRVPVFRRVSVRSLSSRKLCVEKYILFLEKIDLVLFWTVKENQEALQQRC